MLAYVLKDFRNKCLEIYGLNPVHFLSAPGLGGYAGLKIAKVKLYFLIDNDMLLMADKAIRDGICHAIHQYGAANNKYMEDYHEKKESCQVLGCEQFTWIGNVSKVPSRWFS